MPRFAANISMMFNEVPFLERFRAASEAGFEAVEYLFPYEHPAKAVSEALRAAGLRQAVFNMPPGDFMRGDRGLAALPARRQEFNQSLRTALRYAREIGTPLLHIMAGVAERNDETIAVYRESITRAADAAGEFGIGLVIEPINGHDMPGYFLNSFSWAATFLEELAHPNVKLQFDIYHCQLLQGDVHRTLKRLLPLIAHIQVASVPLRHEPGTGELDDSYIFQLLDEIGYTGYLGCEYRPRGKTIDGLGWLSQWKKRSQSGNVSTVET